MWDVLELIDKGEAEKGGKGAEYGMDEAKKKPVGICYPPAKLATTGSGDVS